MSSTQRTSSWKFCIYSCSRLHVQTEPLLDLTGNLIIVNNCSFKIMENVTEEPPIPTPPACNTPCSDAKFTPQHEVCHHVCHHVCPWHLEALGRTFLLKIGHFLLGKPAVFRLSSLHHYTFHRGVCRGHGGVVNISGI